MAHGLDRLTTGQRGILEEIAEERGRQDEKWGADGIVWRSTETGVRVLGEEYGEVCRAVNERDRAAARTELIHTAAVAVQMVEALDADAPLVAWDFSRDPNPREGATA